MGQPILEVEHLKKSYVNNVPILDDVSFSLQKGEVVVIVGPSGCGKSTFLKTLNRMNDLVENCKIDGNVLLDGKDIFKEMDEITLRHRVGMVFQQPNPFPKSVYDNVAYGPRISGIKKKSQLDEIVERSLRQAAIWDELKDRLNKSALGLSGGQQQRVGLARALAAKPSLMLLDEPFGAIDAINRTKLQDELMKIHKRAGLTCMFVTHDVTEALKLGTRIMIMNQGKIQQFDTAKNILEYPANAYVASLLQSVQEGLNFLLDDTFYSHIQRDIMTS